MTAKKSSGYFGSSCFMMELYEVIDEVIRLAVVDV